MAAMSCDLREKEGVDVIDETLCIHKMLFVVCVIWLHLQGRFYNTNFDLYLLEHFLIMLIEVFLEYFLARF